MVENWLVEEEGKKKQAYAPVSFSSHLFNTSQLKRSTCCIELLALYFGLEHFSHFNWSAEKPVIV